MGILSRVEAFLERFFEAPAGRLGASIQPVSLAKRIERAMDTNKSVRRRRGHRAEPATRCTCTPPTSRHLPRIAHRWRTTSPTAFWPAPVTSDTRSSLGRGCRSSRTPTTRRGEIRVAANVVDEHGDRVPDADADARPARDTMVFARPSAVAPPDSARRAFLMVSTRGSDPVHFDLGGPLIGIGRASDNDVIVDDPMVSRHHCQLKLQHGAYGFTDLGSRNGSTVNGETVSQIALGPGDLIRIGDTEIEFQVRT